MSPGRRPALLRYFAAACIVAVCLLLRGLLDPLIHRESPYVILLGAAMLAAWFGGFGPGAFAVLLSALGANYFFLDSDAGIFVPGTLINAGLIVFVLEGMFVSWLTENLHVALQKHAASERQLAEADVRKDEFLATLGHEMRNPLATIRHAIAILKDARATPAQCSRARDTLERQSDYLTRMIDDILDVSRITRGKLVLKNQKLDLREVVARAVEQCRNQIDARRHEFLVSVPAEAMMVDGDIMRLTQVVSNLLTNAAKYTDEGGRIILQATVDEFEATISVRDSGIGISPEMLPRVFQLLSQSDRSISRSQGGLGLGLAVVRSIVERHRGTVMAYSAGAGRGSEFVVRIPRATARPEPSRAAIARRRARRTTATSTPTVPTATVSNSMSGLLPSQLERRQAGFPSPRALRILIVDDNEDIASGLSTLLRLDGHDTRTAGNGAIAVEMARSYKPHVVLLDLHLPDADGCDIARQFRQEFQGQPLLLVAMTGHSGEEVRRRCRDSGFDEYLLKPVRHTDLVDRLSRFAADRVMGKTNSSVSIPTLATN
ncbi:MAG: hybrid sensor histidine kinase/response regulator [Planctomycetaceae bacterium]|nr:hybrid sensor histidine kinase/response regulator [Planctomycetaceae bacterium]